MKPNAQKTEMFWGEKTFAPLFLHNNATFSPMPFQKFDGRPALMFTLTSIIAQKRKAHAANVVMQQNVELFFLEDHCRYQFTLPPVDLYRHLYFTKLHISNHNNAWLIVVFFSMENVKIYNYSSYYIK